MENDIQHVLGSRTAWLQLRQKLMRFAVSKLRNRELAEDVVQDTITAALVASAGFHQRASVQTWVFSILKNKIVDVFRDRWNKQHVCIADSADEDADFDSLFEQNALWHAAESSSSWGNPEISMENQQFWQIFEQCLNSLPETTARVFYMRELIGLETDEICKELGISSSNCWVILHRARMSLRLRLQQSWFQQSQINDVLQTSQATPVAGT